MVTSNELVEKKNLLHTFSVSVIVEHRPSSSPWTDKQIEVVAVAAGTAKKEKGAFVPIKISQQGEVTRYMVTGFTLQLHVDECESYYHNLMSDTPRCFVIANHDDENGFNPYLVSLSFDEAHAYLEGEESVFAVDIPPELYRWSEEFVLANYVPVKKTKRKLKNWNNPEGGVHT